MEDAESKAEALRGESFHQPMPVNFPWKEVLTPSKNQIKEIVDNQCFSGPGTEIEPLKTMLPLTPSTSYLLEHFIGIWSFENLQSL